MKVLVFGYGGKSTSAVSDILLNLFKTFPKKDVEFVLYGYGEAFDTCLVSKNIKVVSIKDPFSKKAITSERLKRKLSRILKIDSPLISWKRIYKKSKKLFRGIKFDYVFAAAGYFMYVEAAYRFAKNNSIPFGVFYFDPFTNNIFSLNKKKRIRIEKRWYDYAKCIFRDVDGAEFPFLDSKKIVSNFNIPIFEQDSLFSPKGPIIYGGTFYKGLRNPSSLEKILNENNFCDEKFIIFTNYSNFKIYKKNVTIRPLVSSLEFDEVCKTAKAIIVVGNSNNLVSPSKIIKIISFKKPLIGIGLSNTSQLLNKYPLYYDGLTLETISSINELREENLENLRLADIFPELNPKILHNSIEKVLNNFSR